MQKTLNDKMSMYKVLHIHQEYNLLPVVCSMSINVLILHFVFLNRLVICIQLKALENRNIQFNKENYYNWSESGMFYMIMLMMDFVQGHFIACKWTLFHYILFLSNKSQIWTKTWIWLMINSSLFRYSYTFFLLLTHFLLVIIFMFNSYRSKHIFGVA